MNFQELRIRPRTLVRLNLGYQPEGTEGNSSRFGEGPDRIEEITARSLFRYEPLCVGLLEELRSESWCTLGASQLQGTFYTSFKQGSIGWVGTPRITLSQGKPKERTVKGFSQAP